MPEPRSLSRAGLLVLLAGVVACAAIAQTSFWAAHGALTGQFDDFALSRNAGLSWYAAMGVLAVILCRRLSGEALPSWPGSRRRWAVVLVVLIAAGAWLRFFRLDELPPGLWIDEALNGVRAVEIARSGRPLVALPPEDVRTGLGAGFVNVAGAVFAFVDPDDGPYAVRAVAAGIGIAGLAAAAALAWVLFGPRVAVVATAWLAVSQYHVNYSRWGEMPLMSSVVETLVALGCAVGLRARGWRSWAGLLAAGALAGAGFYTYQTFRLFAVVAGCGAALLALRHRAAVAARWPQLVAAAALAGVVAAPMVHYAVTQAAEFGERAQGTLIPGRDDWREQLADSIPRSLLAFQLVGDDNPRHNLPMAPLLGFVAAMLAPIGLVVCACRVRAVPYLVVLAWFLIALLPGILTLEAPHASRLLDGIVPLALMIGIAVDLLCGTLQAALPSRVGLVAGTVALLLGFAAMGRQEYRAYFVERERLPIFFDAFFPYESAPGRYLAARAPTATVFLDPSTYFSPATEFVARRYLDARPNDVRMLRLAHDFPPPVPAARDAIYLLPRPYASLAGVIRALAPDAFCDTQRDPFGRIDLVACTVPRVTLNAVVERAWAGTLRWPHGLRGRFYRSPDGSGAPYHEAVLPFGFVEYDLADDPVGRFGFAAWEGFIDIPRAGEYLFRLHPDSTALTIDGRRVIDDAGEAAFGGGHNGQIRLAAGRQPIRITFRGATKVPYFLWFVWEPPGAEVEPVPATALVPPAGD